MSGPAGGGSSEQPVDIYPIDLNVVAGVFAKGQDHLDTATTALSNALRDAGGMAGNDSYGQKFGHQYDPAAKALFVTLSAAIRAIGQASEALVTTANNYLKADHHSNPSRDKSALKLYPWPTVVTDIMYPDPASAMGPGHSSVPSAIAKYWPNGHQDKLRDAASAYRTASTAFKNLGHTLHTQVQSLTDNNSDESVTAMVSFWAKIWQDGAEAQKAPLSAAHQACDKLASACDKFAQAIDDAHSSTETKLAGAGIAIGLTTALGILLTPFTGGGSDAGAAALDGTEAGAILGSVEVTLDAELGTISTEMIGDIETYLQAAADGVPEIETVDAETTEVSQELEEELARTAREPMSVGGRGGAGEGGGPEPPTGGDEDPVPGEDPNGPEALAKRIDPDNLKMTKTVENHFNDITKSGQSARPFMKSNQLAREIMEGSRPTPDPRGVGSAVRWDTPGALNGKEGTWELLVDSKTNTILHFNFVR